MKTYLSYKTQIMIRSILYLLVVFFTKKNNDQEKISLLPLKICQKNLN